MRQLGNLNLLVIFSILFLVNDSSGLRCWRCSSDSTNSKFCGATVDHSLLTETQKNWFYVECGMKPRFVENIENVIPKCRVLLQLVNGIETYTRSCYFEPENVPSNSCAAQGYNPSFVKTVACNTCVEDGCNDKLINDKTNSADSMNAAVLSVLSHTVLLVMLMLSIVIGC